MKGSRNIWKVQHIVSETFGSHRSSYEAEEETHKHAVKIVLQLLSL